MYLDANASSALRPEANDAILGYLQDSSLRNPSSVHAAGRGARARLTESRKAVLRFLGQGKLLKAKLIFTSGGTEACNSLVSGFLAGMPGEVVTTAIEHPAMLEAARKYGSKVKEVSVADNGIVDVAAFVSAVSKETAIVSIMAANNETGALQPVAEIAALLRQQNFQGAIVADCTQAIGKSEISIEALFASGVDAIALSGHKLGSLSGVGAVVLAESSERCFRFEPLLVGGPQEKRFRAGSENLLGIISLGAVCQKLEQDGVSERDRITTLRNLLWSRLSATLDGVFCLTPGVAEENGAALGNTLLLRCAGVRGDDLVVALDLKGVAASTGSACSSGRQDISPVLLAMNIGKEAGREVLRLSLDWDANELEIRQAAKIIAETVSEMRQSASTENQGQRYGN